MCVFTKINTTYKSYTYLGRAKDNNRLVDIKWVKNLQKEMREKKEGTKEGGSMSVHATAGPAY